MLPDSISAKHITFSSRLDNMNIFDNLINQSSGLLDCITMHWFFQARSLANAVFAYAENVDKLGNLGDLVERMTHKHISFHVLPEHYPIVGGSLLKAIKETLGDAATDEVMEGWKEGYFFLADLLIGIETKMRDDYKAKPGT